VTQRPNGSVARIATQIANNLGPEVTPDQVLLAWTKKRMGSGVVVTQSSKKSRLEGYLAAGDLSLSDEDAVAIDEAGARGDGVCAWLLKPEWRALLVVAFIGAFGLAGLMYEGCV
jgi:diketogulonate reductase-like aldo/keto reductase